jgi:hypothetical protein
MLVSQERVRQKYFFWEKKLIKLEKVYEIWSFTVCLVYDSELYRCDI